MTTRSSDELLSAYDAPLNRRYGTTYSILTIGISLDYFDFFIVAFLIAALDQYAELETHVMFINGSG
jgi:hypothetical protein